ncbi:hypothetical protein MTR_3g114250 [Medicago truncatula]|uniref:PIF1 helicase n=1 Tax=Medicago truncatula TaxID=3880 RepID=G7J5B5_MEDTR|nr:hypothetical protein MTR_3g114250 [Medicago truncatula]
MRVHDFPLCLVENSFQLSFAITINKSQGHTIRNVGIYLPQHVFSHGQLYVVLSRGVSQNSIKVMIHDRKIEGEDGDFTKNVVFKDILLSCRYPQPLVDRVCFQSSFVFFLLHWICIPPSSSSCLREEEEITVYLVLFSVGIYSKERYQQPRLSPMGPSRSPLPPQMEKKLLLGKKRKEQKVESLGTWLEIQNPGDNLSYVWVIWKERNRRIFNNKEELMQ